MDLKETVISRRDLIAKGAVAGGILWAAPAIESFAYRASAQSGKPGGGIACSWAYILYTDPLFPGKVLVSGYSGSGAANDCMSFSANPKNTASITCGASTYGINSFTGPPADTDFTVNGSSTNVMVQTSKTTCQSDLTQSGNTIQAGSDVTILAAFAFGGALKMTSCGSKLCGFCPASTNVGNSIVLPSTC
ncbi:MAG: hypothetical protein ACRDZQ_05230 [Acidimicrobiales bacterium]